MVLLGKDMVQLSSERSGLVLGCYITSGIIVANQRRIEECGDKGRFGSYLKLCNFTLLFMTLQVELRLNKRIISETQTS